MHRVPLNYARTFAHFPETTGKGAATRAVWLRVRVSWLACGVERRAAAARSPAAGMSRAALLDTHDGGTAVLGMAIGRRMGGLGLVGRIGWVG
jgi:hypothetical protein